MIHYVLSNSLILFKQLFNTPRIEGASIYIDLRGPTGVDCSENPIDGVRGKSEVLALIPKAATHVKWTFPSVRSELSLLVLRDFLK